jgi:hypothetical protein
MLFNLMKKIDEKFNFETITEKEQRKDKTLGSVDLSCLNFIRTKRFLLTT